MFVSKTSAFSPNADIFVPLEFQKPVSKDCDLSKLQTVSPVIQKQYMLAENGFLSFDWPDCFAVPQDKEEQEKVEQVWEENCEEEGKFQSIK